MAMEMLHCGVIYHGHSCACAASSSAFRFSALSWTTFKSSPCLCWPQRQTRWGNSLKQMPRRYPAAQALELDQDTLVAVAVGFLSIGVGIAIPVFYENQINNAANRENDQPCFPCKGSGAQTCRFCLGEGSINVELGGGETDVSKCINCEGAGSLTCTTCQGTGIQPRYLDRREYKDDD